MGLATDRSVERGALTAKQTMHVVRLCPNVTDLQLHRTDVSADQLADIGRLLPKLEVLWFKPRNGLTASHLKSLSDFRKLKIFSPQQFRDAIPYKSGWDSLASLPALRRLEIAGSAAAANREQLKLLCKERPNLVVDSRLTRSRNYNGL